MGLMGPMGLMGRKSPIGPISPISIRLPHLLHALLAGDRLPRALSGAGVRLGPLAADGQAAAVSRAAVAVNVPQPGDVLLHRPPQLALDDVLAVQERRQPADLVVVQFTGPTLR